MSGPLISPIADGIDVHFDQGCLVLTLKRGIKPLGQVWLDASSYQNLQTVISQKLADQRPKESSTSPAARLFVP